MPSRDSLSKTSWRGVRKSPGPPLRPCHRLPSDTTPPSRVKEGWPETRVRKSARNASFGPWQHNFPFCHRRVGRWRQFLFDGIMCPCPRVCLLMPSKAGQGRLELRVFLAIHRNGPLNRRPFPVGGPSLSGGRTKRGVDRAAAIILAPESAAFERPPPPCSNPQSGRK